MEINKAIELGLEWAEKRMASELTEMDKEYLLTGVKASLVKNCSIPDAIGQSELLTDFVVWLNENRAQYEIPEHDDVKEYLGCL